MDIVLDDENQRIYGEETITYHNNSKDNLTYLWLQLDQNMRAADSKRSDMQSDGATTMYSPTQFSNKFLEPFDGGFKIEYVKNSDGTDASYLINQTMMRLNLDKPLASGEIFSFNIKWWYNINNHRTQGGRSGYEHFTENGNNNYVIAQFYPLIR